MGWSSFDQVNFHLREKITVSQKRRNPACLKTNPEILFRFSAFAKKLELASPYNQVSEFLRITPLLPLSPYSLIFSLIRVCVCVCDVFTCTRISPQHTKDSIFSGEP